MPLLFNRTGKILATAIQNLICYYKRWLVRLFFGGVHFCKSVFRGTLTTYQDYKPEHHYHAAHCPVCVFKHLLFIFIIQVFPSTEKEIKEKDVSSSFRSLRCPLTHSNTQSWPDPCCYLTWDYNLINCL